MLIRQQLVLPVTADSAWPFFSDIPAVAECVPGAEGVEQIGPAAYRGRLSVRIGPLGLAMAGTLDVLERSDAEHRLTLGVKAEDRRLASAAEATVTLRVEPVSATTSRLLVEAETSVRGKLAQFGQGMIKLAADDVLKRFAARVAQRLDGEHGREQAS